jgi:hypothetical protein
MSKGTTNIELQAIVDKLGILNFKGIFCKDQLTGTPNDTECAIINLDDSDGTGTHWCAYYRKSKSNFYFSSFGDDPPNEIVSYLGKPILTHNICLQEFEDSNCGEYTILFLYLMSKNIPYGNIILSMLT